MKNYLLIFLAILSCNFLLFAGTTGKIAGRIIDEQTGEPLPGANVQIEGTTLGAAADANGNYTILNIPPGLYTVKMAFIGYQAVSIKDVRVNVDFTTRMDQKLNPSTIEMAEIEVYGERNPLVRQDLTNSLVAITSKDIEQLPVDQISDVIALTAGVVQDNNGAIHIRGGRSNEIAYEVNGISINNPFSNGQGVGLATNAVQEVSVSTGTFSAEYGNALSGVINFVTKDGGPTYNGSLKAYSGDHFSSRNDVFFNIDERDLLNNKRFEFTLSGPVPLFGKKLTFFSSGVYQKDNGYLYGIDLYKRNDLLFFSGDDILIDPFGFPPTLDELFSQGFDSTAIGASGSGDAVPLVTTEDINFSGKLTWKPTNTFKVTYDLVFDDGERFTRSSFRRWRFTPDGRPKVLTNNTSHSVGITHTLNAKTFYTLKFGLNTTKRRQGVFEDTFDPRYFFVTENDIDNQIIQPTDVYVAGGNDLFRKREQSRTIMAKLDVVSQVLPSHEIKFGAEFKKHRLELEEFDLLFDFDEAKFIIPFPELNSQFTDYQAYTRNPVQFAVYLQDKIELSNIFIFNAGLRYEFFDSKAPYNPDLSGTIDSGVASSLIDSSPKHRLSPRLSLSFPITDEGVIRFSYGFFYQNPPMNRIYANPRFEDFDFIQNPTFGNANLEPERSIQYEMGLQQQFTDDVKIDFTIFYKDVNNLIQTRQVLAGDVALSKIFNVVTNISYANVKGFTASLLKRRSQGGLFSATLDYTFQVGEGAFTDPANLGADTRTDRVTAQQLVPLDFDRTHTLNATIALAKSRNWTFSALSTLQSGTPYTPVVVSSVQAVEFEENSARRPTNFKLDLKFEKFFHLKSTRFSVFARIENALDLKNERFVHRNTGRSLNNLDEVTRAGLFNNLKAKINADPQNFFPVSFLNNFYQREDWLSEPREIRAGMTFEF